MNEHTHKQFDAEMESIRTRRPRDGRAGRDAARARDRRAGDDEDGGARSTSVGADEQQINQMQMTIDQQCTQIIAKRQPTAIDLRMIMTITKIVNDLERIGDEVKKIAYKAAAGARQRPADAGPPLRRRRARRPSAQRMLQHGARRLRAARRRGGGRGHRPRRGDRRRVLRDHAPADQLHDGGPADDHAGARDRVHRQVDRAHRRPREEHRRGRRAGGQGQGRAARVGRADPGRGRRRTERR